MSRSEAKPGQRSQITRPCPETHAQSFMRSAGFKPATLLPQHTIIHTPKHLPPHAHTSPPQKTHAQSLQLPTCSCRAGRPLAAALSPLNLRGGRRFRAWLPLRGPLAACPSTSAATSSSSGGPPCDQPSSMLQALVGWALGVATAAASSSAIWVMTL
eukprot:1160452-Pelagomonas_calceolata.AAC.3